MNANSQRTFERVVLAVSLVALLLGCGGCQSFNLTKEQFEKQQRGDVVDRDVGGTVETVGTLGYYCALLGQVVAAAVRK